MVRPSVEVIIVLGLVCSEGGCVQDTGKLAAMLFPEANWNPRWKVHGMASTMMYA